VKGKKEQATAAERGWKNLKGFKDFRVETGSIQGHNLALTGLFVPNWNDSGPPRREHKRERERERERAREREQEIEKEREREQVRGL